MAEQRIIRRKLLLSKFVCLHLWLLGIFLFLLVLFHLGARIAVSQLPRIGQTIEEQIEKRLAVSIHVGDLQGQVNGLYPVIRLQGLELTPLDQGATPLAIDEATFTINPWRSLWRKSLQLEALTLSGASLHLVVDESGSVRLRGQGSNQERTEFTAEQLTVLLEVAYDQKTVVLENIHVRFDFPKQPSIESDNVQLALVKRGSERLLAIDFDAPHQTLSLSMRLHLAQKAYSFNSLAGALHLSLRGERLERWLPEQWPIAFVPARVSGKIELWSELRKGGLADVTVALSQGQLSLVHRDLGGVWELDEAAFVAQGKRLEDRYLLQLESVSGHNEKAGHLRVGPIWFELAGSNPLEHEWRMRGQKISLDGLARHIKTWPFVLPPSVLSVLHASPKGEVVSFELVGQGAQWQRLGAYFEEVAIGDEESAIKLAGLSGWVSGTPAQGVVQLEPGQTFVGLPQLFKQPLVAQLGGALTWAQQDDGYLFSSGRLHLINQDAKGDALLKLMLTQGNDPYLQLRAEITQGRVSKAATYIPLLKLPAAASQWLEQAFIGGELERGRFLYEGTIKPDPTQPWQRTFLMSYETQAAELHLAPNWPNMQQVSGKVVIDGAAVSGEGLSASYLGQHLQDIRLDIIPEFERTRLKAEGRFSGEADVLNRLFTQTPLHQQIPKALQEWQVQGGEANGKLRLSIPLAPKAPKLAVEVNAAFSELRYGAEPLRLEAENLNGEAEFTLTDGLQIPQFTGRLFGKPITGRVTSTNNNTQLSVSGEVEAKALKQWLSLDWLRHTWGEAGYQFSLNLPRSSESEVNWQLYSDLQGLGIDLPAPLNKTSKAKQPLTLLWRPDKQGQRMLVRSKWLQGDLLLGNNGLERGHIHFGEGKAEIPSRGVAITGQVASLDISAWQQLLVADAVQESNVLGPQVQVALSAEAMYLGALGGLGAGYFSASQGDEAWQLQVKSQQLTGELWVPLGYQPRGDRPLTAYVEEVKWPFQTKALSRKTTTFEVLPSVLPVADVRVNRVLLDDKALGRWQAQIRPTAEGTLFDALQGRWHGTTLLGRLHWREQQGQQISELQATVDSQDLETLFQTLGLASFIEGEQANSQWQISWQGAPWDFDYQQLDGEFSLHISKAFMPTSDKRTSALRMLGVLNLGHTLKRRLRLDFSDVMNKGLVVDKLTADHYIKGAQLTSNNIEIHSPSAEFRVAGALDLITGELDSAVEVTLPLSSNLYAGCIAGIAACAGIFVVERLWGNRLEKMTSMEYQVTGPWYNPKVDDVNGIFEKKRQQYKH